MIDEHFVSSS